MILLAVHRLDKLTSGIVILAKSKEVCEKVHSSLKTIEAHKFYLARVHGEVKFVEFVIDRNIKCLSKRLSKYETCDVEEPTGKPSKTKFQLVFYDKLSDTSLLKCRFNKFSADWSNTSNQIASKIRRFSDCQ